MDGLVLWSRIFSLPWSVGLSFCTLGVIYAIWIVIGKRKRIEERRVRDILTDRYAELIETLPHFGADTQKSKWKNKGWTRIAGAFVMFACLGFIILGMMSIPVEHAAIVNQTKTTTEALYLPHVDEEMDQYHYFADPSGDAKRRMSLTFCVDGLEPPWNEGQTITWMTFRVEKDCLQLLGYDGKRDKQHKIINDGGE